MNWANPLQTKQAPSTEGNADNQNARDDEDRIVNPSNPEQVAKRMEQDRAREEARRMAPSQPKLSQLTSISGTGRGTMMGAPSSDKKKKKKRKSY